MKLYRGKVYLEKSFYLNWGEILHKVIIHNCFLDKSFGTEILLEDNHVDIGLQLGALAGHALLLGQPDLAQAPDMVLVLITAKLSNLFGSIYIPLTILFFKIEEYPSYL